MIESPCFDLEATLYSGVLFPQHERVMVPQGAGLGIKPDSHVIRDYLKV